MSHPGRAGLTAVFASLVPLLAAAAAPAEPALSGTWQKHEHFFSYAGFTAQYSCDGLGDKLKLLLLAAGARADAKVTPSCSDPRGGPSRIATANLTFYTLVPAGAAPAAPGKRASTQPAAPPEPGVGAWKTVVLRERMPRELEGGDCELVDQFAREILPMFTTRKVESHMTCVPHQISLGGINLRFESLAPLPKSDKAGAPPAAQ